MKLLTWLFKKSPFTKRTSLKILAISALISVVIFVSCQISQKSVDSASSNESPSWNPLSLISSEQQYFPIIYNDQKNNVKYKIAEISRDSCIDLVKSGKATLFFRLLIRSPFGDDVATFRLSSDEAGKGATAEISGQKILISQVGADRAPLFKQICEAASKDQRFETSDEEALIMVQAWQTTIAPDCRFSEPTASGLVCRLPTIEPRMAVRELTQIQSTMIRSWSRQPYLLSRRLALSLNLAEVLDSQKIHEGLDRFCSVISYSKAEELPLTISTPQWRASVCDKPDLGRIDAALVGLNKALEEIETMRELFERTSRLGILSIKIPRDVAPSKDFWISLIPEQDVSNQLVAEASKVNSDNMTDFSIPKACWHPVFKDNPSLLHISVILGLAGETAGISCVTKTSKEDDEKNEYAPSKYLADSITSETEFVITNGRSKMLRLPPGTYQYVIRSHSEILGWQPPPDEASQGSLSWLGKRPAANIDHWTQAPKGPITGQNE